MHAHTLGTQASKPASGRLSSAQITGCGSPYSKCGRLIGGVVMKPLVDIAKQGRATVGACRQCSSEVETPSFR